MRRIDGLASLVWQSQESLIEMENIKNTPIFVNGAMSGGKERLRNQIYESSFIGNRWLWRKKKTGAKTPVSKYQIKPLLAWPIIFLRAVAANIFTENAEKKFTFSIFRHCRYYGYKYKGVFEYLAVNVLEIAVW